MVGDDDIRRIDTLVEKLPRDAAGEFLDRIEHEPGDGPRKAAVRQALLKHLNAPRRQHARRLFTSLFDPFLCRDPLFLRADLSTTGTIHPIDLGAVWAWLSGGPLHDLAVEVDQDLKRRSEAVPIGRVLASKEACAMRERLRTQAAATLGPVLESNQACQTLVGRLNEWRREEAGHLQGLPQPRALTRDDLVLLRGLLLSGPAVADLVARALAGLSRRSLEPMERLVGEAAALPAVPEDARTGQADVGRMVPLTLLHCHGAYALMPDFLTHAPAAWREMLSAAMVAHLARAGTGIGETLSAVSAPGGVRGGPLVVPLTRREELDRDLEAMDELLVTADEFGLLSDGRHGPVIRDRLGAMIKRVEHDLYPALIDRCVVATRSTQRATPDHEALDWLLTFAARWRAALTRNLHWGTGYSDFKAHVLEDLRDGFAKTFVQAGYPAARDRIDHATRLGGLAKRFGADPGEWLSLLDKGLIQVATDRMRDGADLGVPERDLLMAVFRLVQAELKRTRYWKSPELQDFAELAAARLGVEAPTPSGAAAGGR